MEFQLFCWFNYVPFHYSVLNGYYDVVELLLKQKEMNINILTI